MFREESSAIPFGNPILTLVAATGVEGKTPPAIVEILNCCARHTEGDRASRNAAESIRDQMVTERRQN